MALLGLSLAGNLALVFLCASFKAEKDYRDSRDGIAPITTAYLYQGEDCVYYDWVTSFSADKDKLKLQGISYPGLEGGPQIEKLVESWELLEYTTSAGEIAWSLKLRPQKGLAAARLYKALAEHPAGISFDFTDKIGTEYFSSSIYEPILEANPEKPEREI